MPQRGRVGLTYVEAQDIALRDHARLPIWSEDDELIDDWIDLIAAQRGHLAEAIAEANHYAGPPNEG
jgi:hypothetical protein